MHGSYIYMILLLITLIRHSRSCGDFSKNISPHLVSLIKVEGLFSPKTINFTFVKLHTYIHNNNWHERVRNNITYPQFYHDFITMRGAMPTQLGTNPHNHVKHYSCSSMENFYYYYDTHIYIYMIYTYIPSKVIRTTASIIINC